MPKAARTVEVAGEPEPLAFRLPPDLANFYTLSPFAVYRDGAYELLVRLVNPSDDASNKVSRIHFASSMDGVTFDVGREVIGPGNRDEPDGAGCEDPTVVRRPDSYYVFYSGYNALQKKSTMLGATGDTLRDLVKSGIVLPPNDGYPNPKEAALAATPIGFRLFFEYVRDGASLIGAADSQRIEGPWKYSPSPLRPRTQLFDSWHLSPASSIPREDGTHALLYNGASKEAAWRIGYAVIDRSADLVLERPEESLVKPFGLITGDTDIAFASSAIMDAFKRVWLYFTIADRKSYRVRLSIVGV